MQKLFLLLFITILLTSCIETLGLKNQSVKNEKIYTGVFVEIKEKLKEDILEENNDITNTGTTEERNESGTIDEGGSFSGLFDEENTEDKLNLKDIPKVLSIEEQYCKSRGGKVETVNSRQICFITDRVGLLKCEVGVFYLDKCRDRLAIAEDGIVIRVKEEPKVIINTDSGQTVLNSDIKENQEDIIEKNLGNGFIFRQDSNNKYLYLEDLLITKIADNGKIIMGVSSGSVFSFNVYLDSGDLEPSKVFNVDTKTKTFTEKDLIVETSTGKIDTTTEEKINSDNNQTKIKLQTGVSGTYYISSDNLMMETNSGELITLFSGSLDLKVYDYELLVNKQIKVFYYDGTGSEKEEKIIDLNEFIGD